MSPFLYRVDLMDAGGGSATARIRLPYPLANRLSYFLWASTPDRQLMTHAASGDLENREVLLAEIGRMVRIRGMAAEFGGNWLDFRHFVLREAMFQEPVRFLENLIRNNGSVLDLIYGNYTFANPPLAAHYDMPPVNGDRDTWVRVDDARKYGRGGILPMAVFLTDFSRLPHQSREAGILGGAPGARAGDSATSAGRPRITGL